MRRIFADAVYWVAIANRKDQWYAKVVTVMRSLGRVTLVTTEEVLDEFLAHYSGHGPVLRNLAAATVEKAMANPLVIVRPQSHQSFLDGLALFKARPDKEYSLTDCISMEAMRQEAITEILTHDRHFRETNNAQHARTDPAWQARRAVVSWLPKISTIMTIHFPENLESSVLAAVHTGRYASLDDAMAEAASLLSNG